MFILMKKGDSEEEGRRRENEFQNEEEEEDSIATISWEEREIYYKEELTKKEKECRRLERCLKELLVSHERLISECSPSSSSDHMSTPILHNHQDQEKHLILDKEEDEI